jgi:glycosyltransferase involved in cell wall biosynthesis
MVYLYLKYFSGKVNYETHFITNGGDSLERLNEVPNLKYQQLNFSTGYKNIFCTNDFYNNLKDYVSKNKINLIHTHHRFLETVAVKLGKELNVSTITTAHSFVKGFRNSSFKSDKIMSVSNSITNYLIGNYRIPKEKIVTLYNPLDPSLRVDLLAGEGFKKENNISSDQKVLLFIGRITKDKGYDTLLKSFELISRKNKNVVLIMIRQIDRKLMRLKSVVFNDKIIFLPPQNNISYLYSVADIVVLPSRIEPLGLVMIEAGAFKKPFIGGNTGGIAEFIEDGKNGLLVDPENSKQLAEKIIYLLNNPEVGKMFGQNLFEKVNRLCDYNNYFNEVEKIYNSLLTSL